MNLSKAVFKTLVLVSLAVGGANLLYAQQNEASYQVTLHLIAGTDESGPRGEIPTELSGVVRQIKSQFGFGNYRLSSTFLGRLTSAGSFTYRSATNSFGKDLSGPPTFLEWSTSEFRAAAAGKTDSFTAESFTFGARIPLVNGSDNKAPVVVNYEQIGITLRRLRLVENTPTLIGTLSLPGTSGTIFLIMTVKSAD